MERYYPTNLVRQDEVFWKTNTPPTMSAWGWDWLLRRVHWTMDGSKLTSTILLWFVRWYSCTGKADATQTQRLRREEPTYANGYVITTTPKEMLSVRLSWKKPDRERWDNVGGI